MTFDARATNSAAICVVALLMPLVSFGTTIDMTKK